MGRKPKLKNPQDYSDDEFQQIVNIINTDPDLREDIEAITGQKLDGKKPREVFNLFRAIQGAAEVQVAVAQYGRARQMVRQVRAEMEDTEAAEKVLGTARSRINALEEKTDRQRQEIERLRAANAALNRLRGATPLPTAGRVVPGTVVGSAPAPKAVGQ